MASLSELSVVIAFRDWQWKNRIVDAGKMELFVPLTGKADQHLGDIFIEPNDRLVLLEVKSGADKVQSEWAKKTVETKDPSGKILGTTKVKNAYLHLRSQLIANAPIETPESSEGIRAFCRASLAAHHLLYWVPQKERPGLYKSVPGKLAIEPYFLGIYDQDGFKKTLGSYAGDDPQQVDRSATFAAGRFFTARSVHEGSGDPSEKIDFVEASPLDLSMIYSESARLIEIDDRSGRAENFWYYIGLEPDAFKTYVQSLCRDPEIEIQVVITSISGDVVAHADTVGGLMNLISRIKVKEQPTPQSASSGHAMRGNPMQRATRRPLRP